MPTSSLSLLCTYTSLPPSSLRCFINIAPAQDTAPHSLMPKGRHGVRKKQAGSTQGSRQAAAAGQGVGAVTAEGDQQPLFVDLGRQESARQSGTPNDKRTGTPASPALACPQLVTLAFRSKAAQHAALARVEAFYESAAQTKEYVDLKQAASQRQCSNYEAFNVPISTVRNWLQAMRLATRPPCAEGAALLEADIAAIQLESEEDAASGSNRLPTETEFSASSAGEAAWWTPHCSHEEVELLRYLDELGCFAAARVDDNPSDSRSGSSTHLAAGAGEHAPVYLVSVLASQQAASLAHEQLHFLYHVSADYRAAVLEWYASLLPKTRRIIETDLAMRKYAPHVWPDEFQAYVSLHLGEFGAKTRDECVPIRVDLLRRQRALWSALLSAPAGAAAGKVAEDEEEQHTPQ